MNALKIMTLAVAVMFSACGKKQDNLSIKGSDTVLPLAQKLAEDYMKKYPERIVTVVGGGSGVGIAAMIDGNTVLANASRSIKQSEIQNAKAKGINPVKHEIAKDGLSVIVNPGNPVADLTIDQISKIYSGEVTNWKDVGGNDENIVVYSRESSSGTYVYFKEAVLDKKEYTPSAQLMPATGAIVQAVSQTPGAIGYVGLAYLNDKVKPVQVSEEGTGFVEPSVENVMNGTYPLARGLFQYSNGEASEGMVKDWFDFVFSEEGQAIVRAIGYIPVK